MSVSLTIFYILRLLPKDEIVTQSYKYTYMQTTTISWIRHSQSSIYYIKWICYVMSHSVYLHSFSLYLGHNKILVSTVTDHKCHNTVINYVSQHYNLYLKKECHQNVITMSGRKRRKTLTNMTLFQWRSLNRYTPIII